jgi:hypothetical protein
MTLFELVANRQQHRLQILSLTNKLLAPRRIIGRTRAVIGILTAVIVECIDEA